MSRDQPPEALVFMVGGNDNQRMQRDGDVFDVGSESWYQEYRARVVTIMDSTQSAGRSHLYWIGLPPMRDPERDTLARQINTIVANEAEARSWVSFVDIGPTLSGADGGYATRIAGPDGADRVARAPDGVHITYTGSSWVARQIWAAVEDRWQLPPG